MSHAKNSIVTQRNAFDKNWSSSCSTCALVSKDEMNKMLADRWFSSAKKTIGTNDHDEVKNQTCKLKLFKTHNIHTLWTRITTKIKCWCENAEGKCADAQWHLKSTVAKSKALKWCIRFRFGSLTGWSRRHFCSVKYKRNYECSFRLGNFLLGASHAIIYDRALTIERVKLIPRESSKLTGDLPL